MPASRQSAAPRLAPHAVRIIGGQWKRTLLPVAQVAGLRPTPDRVRETLFNWIAHLLAIPFEQSAALDLFAGTGALGFEAASRGAARVVMVESSAVARRGLEASRLKLGATGVQLAGVDAQAAVRRLAQTGERFDLIFLDPPFHEGLLSKIVLPASRLLTENGLLYIESEIAVNHEQATGWELELLRADKAGQVFYHLLRRKIGDTPRENSPC